MLRLQIFTFLVCGVHTNLTRLQASFGRKPKLGQPCVGRASLCREGSVCDILRNKCRVSEGHSCRGAKAKFCQNETVCDTFERCKRARGSPCANGSSATGGCVAGATCVDLVCTCNTTVSVPEGQLCNPRVGRIGSSCNAAMTCTVPSSVCVSGRCRCIAGVSTSPLHFSCGAATAQFTDVNHAAVISIVVFLFALVAGSFGYLLFLRARNYRRLEKLQQSVIKEFMRRKMLSGKSAASQQASKQPSPPPPGGKLESAQATKQPSTPLPGGKFESPQQASKQPSPPPPGGKLESPQQATKQPANKAYKQRPKQATIQKQRPQPSSGKSKTSEKPLQLSAQPVNTSAAHYQVNKQQPLPSSGKSETPEQPSEQLVQLSGKPVNTLAAHYLSTPQVRHRSASSDPAVAGSPTCPESMTPTVDTSAHTWPLEPPRYSEPEPGHQLHGRDVAVVVHTSSGSDSAESASSMESRDDPRVHGSSLNPSKRCESEQRQLLGKGMLDAGLTSQTRADSSTPASSTSSASDASKPSVK